MNMKSPRVATITGDADDDHAIATLVLAFGTDPVARWMYGDPHPTIPLCACRPMWIRQSTVGACAKPGGGSRTAISGIRRS